MKQDGSYQAVKHDDGRLSLLVLNGPNINLLGLREPGVYGTQTYRDLVALVEDTAREGGFDVSCWQSNHEGELVDAIQWARGVYDGIVILYPQRGGPHDHGTRHRGLSRSAAVFARFACGRSKRASIIHELHVYVVKPLGEVT